jgi:CHRD domain
MANNKITNVMVAVMLGGVFAAGTITSCDDDDDLNVVVTGRGGTTGSAGTGVAPRGGSGGTGTATGGTGGGGPVTTVYTMQLNGALEVPANASAATGNVTVTLDQATRGILIDGTFAGLTSPVTAAHIHGPAPAGMNAAIIIPLTITGTTDGTVSATTTMDQAQMDMMLGGMTYVNIHSTNYPAGEIRAQVQ